MQLLSRRESAKRKKGEDIMSKVKFNSVEMAVISPLARSIDFDHDIARECESRGFLPACLMEPLLVAKFLSRTILAAQLAQRTYGVPASFLIGMALFDSSWDAEDLDLVGDLESDTAEFACFSGVQRWFLEAAKLLAESPKYAKALPLAGDDVKAYGRELAALGFRDSIGVEDILTPIENYGLEDCDLPALCQPNEYTRERFTEFRNERGARQLRPAWLDHISLLQGMQGRAVVPETAGI
jgi:hypothetical protein